MRLWRGGGNDVEKRSKAMAPTPLISLILGCFGAKESKKRSEMCG